MSIFNFMICGRILIFILSNKHITLICFVQLGKKEGENILYINELYIILSM